MFRSPLRLSTRTHGHVFWRSTIKAATDRTMKKHLLSERPFPLADVVRRMTRIRSRYEHTDDFHERALLRGEYKYFTGKTCDLRRAAIPDMVALCETCAFFGFWDVALSDKVDSVLRLRLSELTAIELQHLVRSLPAMAKSDGQLMVLASTRLAALLGDLSLEEQLGVAAATAAATPAVLVAALLAALAPRAEELDAAEAAQLLHALCFAALATEALRDAARACKRTCVDAVDVTGPNAVATLSDNLAALGMLDDGALAVLCKRFTATLRDADSAAVATMLEVTATSAHGDAFAAVLRERVADLVPEMGPTTCNCVLQAYANVLARNGAPAPGKAAGVVAPAGERSRRRHHKDVAVAVLADVVAHLALLADDGSTFFSPDLVVACLSAQCRVAAHQPSLPLFAALIHKLCARSIAQLPSFDAPLCVQFVLVAGVLGGAMLDAAVASIVRRLAQLAAVLSADEAADVAERVRPVLRTVSKASRAVMERELMPALSKRAEHN
jgi:hypothetical protein